MSRSTALPCTCLSGDFQHFPFYRWGKVRLGVKEAIISPVWATGAGFIDEAPFELV